MRTCKTLVIAILAVYTTTLAECAYKVQLPYHLHEVHHAVAGRIAYNALNGDHVTAILEDTESEPEDQEDESTGEYLQIKINPVGQAKSTVHPMDITGMVSKTATQPAAATITTMKAAPTGTADANFERLSTDAGAINGPTDGPISSVKSTGKSHQGQTHVSVHITNSLADIADNEVTPTDQSDMAEDDTHNIHVLRTHRKKRHVVTESYHTRKQTTRVHTTKESASDVTELEDVAGGHAQPLVDAQRHVPVENIIIEGSTIFGVEAKFDTYFLYVIDSSALAEHKLVEFYVYLTDDTGIYLSNPLPFIVYIDRPDIGYPAIPAVFAGVLVLFIVFLALLIPFVTRAKRRYKQGKPMFKLGSHPSTADLVKSNMGSRRESEQSWDQLGPRRESKEPNWYGNAAYYNYEDEVQHERDDFTRGIKQIATRTRTDSNSAHVANRDHPPTLQLHKTASKVNGHIESPTQETASRAAEGSSRDIQKYDGERL